MAKTALLVFTNANEGEDAEFNRWYDEQHVPDALKIDPFLAAQRYTLHPAAADAAVFPWRYLAIYEVDSDDVAAFQAELGKRAGTAAMVLTSALDRTSVKTLVATALGERQLAKPAGA